MLADLDRIGPEIVVMVSAGIILMADLVMRDRNRGWLPFMALAGLGGAALWAVTLILRDREAVAFSGTYSLDTFSIYFMFLFIGVSGLVILASADYVRNLHNQGEFWALLLLATSGMMLLGGARDLILIFIALELTSICQYALAAVVRDGKGGEAGGASGCGSHQEKERRDHERTGTCCAYQRCHRVRRRGALPTHHPDTHEHGDKQHDASDEQEIVDLLVPVPLDRAVLDAQGSVSAADSEPGVKSSIRGVLRDASPSQNPIRISGPKTSQTTRCRRRCTRIMRSFSSVPGGSATATKAIRLPNRAE